MFFRYAIYFIEQSLIPHCFLLQEYLLLWWHCWLYQWKRWRYLSILPEGRYQPRNVREYRRGNQKL